MGMKQFRTNDCARRTCLQAPGVLAMLANVRRERPRVQFRRIAAESRLGRLLDKLHVPPRLRADCASVVVGEAAPIQSVFGDVVPLFARDFASFAADAECGIG